MRTKSRVSNIVMEVILNRRKFVVKADLALKHSGQVLVLVSIVHKTEKDYGYYSFWAVPRMVTPENARVCGLTPLRSDSSTR